MLLLRNSLAMALGLTLTLSPGIAGADWFDEGKAKIGIEYEQENGAGNAWQSRGVTVVSGLKLDNPWISMVELMLEGAQEYNRESGEHARERKFGMRVRHEFPLNDDAKIVLRGLLGHSSQGDENFLYYYVEPSFKYAFKHFEMMVGYRFVHGIDASQEHDLHKFRIGPSIDLSERSEIEFRWARSWNMHTGQHVSDAYIIEYTQKF